MTSLNNELTYDNIEETEEGVKIKQLDHYCEDPILFFPLINKKNAYILKTSSSDYKSISHTYTIYHIQAIYNWISKHGTDPFTRIEIDTSKIEKAYEIYKENYFKEGSIYTIENETDKEITVKGKNQEMGINITKIDSNSSNTIKGIFNNDQRLLFKQTSKGLMLSKKMYLTNKEKYYFNISLGHRNSESILFFQTKENQPYKNYYGLAHEPSKNELFDSIVKNKDTYIIRISKDPFLIELF
jgi:hypothetical protein